jgi:hypothetical protein
MKKNIVKENEITDRHPSEDEIEATQATQRILDNKHP